MQDFSLPAAVVLGCCSFEAYNAPYKSYGLKEVSPCGTETIYMDKEFLSHQICGVLEVGLSRTLLKELGSCLTESRLSTIMHMLAVLPSEIDSGSLKTCIVGASTTSNPAATDQG